MRCFSKSVATSSPQNGPFGFHLPQHEGQDKGRDEVQERDGKGERKRARLQKQMRLRREKRQDGGNDSCRRLGDDPIHCDKDKGDGWSLKDLREHHTQYTDEHKACEEQQHLKNEHQQRVVGLVQVCIGHAITRAFGRVGGGLGQMCVCVAPFKRHRVLKRGDRQSDEERRTKENDGDLHDGQDLCDPEIGSLGSAISNEPLHVFEIKQRRNDEKKRDKQSIGGIERIIKDLEHRLQQVQSQPVVLEPCCFIHACEYGIADCSAHGKERGGIP